jgi:hypothetical protein
VRTIALPSVELPGGGVQAKPPTPSSADPPGPVDCRFGHVERFERDVARHILEEIVAVE